MGLNEQAIPEVNPDLIWWPGLKPMKHFQDCFWAPGTGKIFKI